MEYKTAIFDLSEVLISGIVGIEKLLVSQLNADEAQILMAFSGDNLKKLCSGKMTEDQYIKTIKREQNWKISPQKLKAIIRINFNNVIKGMPGFMKEISTTYEMILYSDHSREWIDYILLQHSFLKIFKTKIFSFDLEKTKNEKGSFELMLSKINKTSNECIFVDDNAMNIANAATAGIESILFINCEDLRSKLSFVSHLS